MPKLRGHHLICLHFFNGKGYDKGFIEELRKVLERAELQGVAVVTGPDDVCGQCPHLDADRCTYTAGADEEIAAMDRDALRLLGVSPGLFVNWQGLRGLVPEVFSQWHEAYCAGCDWRKACEESPMFRELSSTTDRKDFSLTP